MVLVSAGIEGPTGCWTPPLPPGRYVDLPGRGTTWILESPGPPGAPALLLLHGWMATAALNWYAALPDLAERYRVVAMDLRGHGRGIRSRRPFRLEDCADDAAALCRQLDLGPVIAVGYSMGGPIAQVLWQRQPEIVAGLVLCATAGLFASRSRRNMAVKAFGRSLALGVGALPPLAQRELARRTLPDRTETTPMAAWAAAERGPSDLAAVIGAGVALNDWNAGRWLETIDVPVAVVTTIFDSVVAPWRQQLMADAIPGARVFPVAGDHGACIQNPDLFVPALIEACEYVVTQAKASLS